MHLRVGSRWRSAVDETQVIVVRAPEGDVSLSCGGHGMVPLDGEPAPGLTIDESQAAGTLMGKRYADPATGLEVLCVKAGAGSLHLNGTALPVKAAQPLPASD